MKQNTHPVSAPTVFSCSHCKAEIATVSTIQSPTSIDVCSNCHPAYTGKTLEKASGNRINSFNNRYNLKK